MTDNRNLLLLTPEEKQELERWAQSRTLPAGDVNEGRNIAAQIQERVHFDRRLAPPEFA